MKRVALLSLAILVALSACTSGKTIGGGLDDPGTGIDSPRPTPSKTQKPRGNRNGPKPAESPKSTIKVNTIIIAVRSNDEGFEYKLPDKDWTSAFNGGPPAFPEDIIIFKNLDTEGCSEGFLHSWVNEKNDQYAEGELFDSKPLKCGKQFEWVVPNKPGEYRYKDGVVPYRASVGPLVILEARG